MKPNIVSVQMFPRYKMTGRHMQPVVVEAVVRVLFDTGQVSLTEITAERYWAAMGEIGVLERAAE